MGGVLGKCMNCPKCGVVYGSQEAADAIYTPDGQLGCEKCVGPNGTRWPHFIKELKRRLGVGKDPLSCLSAKLVLGSLGCNFCKELTTFEHIFHCGHRACKNCQPEEAGAACKKCSLGPAEPGSDILKFYRKYLKAAIGRDDTAVKDDRVTRLHDEFEVLRRLNKDLSNTTATKNPQARPGDRQKCAGCEMEHNIEALFKCVECEMSICAPCCVKFHKAHDTPELLAWTTELEKIRDEMGEHMSGHYEGYSNNFTWIEQQTRKGFAELNMAKDNALKLIALQPSHARGMEIAKGIKEAGDRMVAGGEKCIPLARVFIDVLTDETAILEKLIADFAVE